MGSYCMWRGVLHGEENEEGRKKTPVAVACVSCGEGSQTNGVLVEQLPMLLGWNGIFDGAMEGKKKRRTTPGMKKKIKVLEHERC